MAGWWQRFRRSETANTAGKADSVYNPATQVTLRELITLQRHARQLDLSRRQTARAQLAGNHPSRFRGRGMDYQESRAYQPGDDIRNMDWRVTARAGRPHTKLFQEERERPVILLIDLNPRLFFATRGALKSVIAARAAALIGWAAAAHGDRIGALLVNGGHSELRPRSGHRGALQLIHALVEHCDPVRGMQANIAQPVDLNGGLERLRRLVRPGSLVFLISDFMDLNEQTGHHLLHLHHHNDLSALRLVDPIELAPPPPGRYGVTDGEHTAVIDTQDPTGQQAYASYFQQQQATVHSVMQRYNIPLLQLSTTDNVVSALHRQFGRQASKQKTAA